MSGREPVGAIMRVHTAKPELVAERVEMAREAIECLQAVEISGQPLIRRVEVMVWTNSLYPDADCGRTLPALRAMIKANDWKGRVFPTEVPYGDIFCVALNLGMDLQNRHGMNWSLIMSSEVRGYLSRETMTAMIDAARQGALVIPVAINELSELVLAGFPDNSLTLWNIEALGAFGRFDLRARKRPPKDPMELACLTWEEKEAFQLFHEQGVEGTIPVTRMILAFKDLPGYRGIVAPILPQGPGEHRYQIPTDPDLLAAHAQKMRSKKDRIERHLYAERVTFDFLGGGVMEDYRNQKM